MKKIKSFTLIEVMIVLVISSIVTAIAYYSLFIIGHQFSNYRRRVEDSQQYCLLATVLEKDFDRADWIRDTVDNKHLVMWHDDSVVYYSFDSSLIVREASGARDSFKIITYGQVTFYVSDSLPLIKGIMLKEKLMRDSMVISADKIYTSKQLMFAESRQYE